MDTITRGFIVLFAVTLLGGQVGCGAKQENHPQPSSADNTPRQAQSEVLAVDSPYLFAVPVQPAADWQQVVDAGEEWSEQEARILNDCLWFLEQVYTASQDPRAPFIRRVTFRAKTGDERGIASIAAAYWSPKLGTVFFDRDELRKRGSLFFPLVLILNHELDHAVHEREVVTDALARCDVEIRAHQSELVGIDQAIAFIEAGSWPGEEKHKSVWMELIDIHRATALVSVEKYRLKAGAIRVLQAMPELIAAKRDSDEPEDLADMIEVVRIGTAAKDYFEIQSGKSINHEFLESMEHEVRKANKALSASHRKKVEEHIDLEEWAQSIKVVRSEVEEVNKRHAKVLARIQSQH